MKLPITDPERDTKAEPPSQDFFPSKWYNLIRAFFHNPKQFGIKEKSQQPDCSFLPHTQKETMPEPPKEVLTFLLSRAAFVSSPLCATAIFPWRVSTTKGWQFCSSEIPEVEYLVCPIPRFEGYSFFRLSALKTWFIRPIPFGRKRKKRGSVWFYFPGDVLSSSSASCWYSVNGTLRKRK